MFVWHGSDTDFIGASFGIFGTITAFLMYLSPTPTTIKIIADRYQSLCEKFLHATIIPYQSLEQYPPLDSITINNA